MWNLIKDEYEKQEECDSRIWKYERIQLAQNENTTEDNPLYVPPAVYETVDVDFLSYYARCKIIVTSIMKCISVNTRQLFKEISCESTIRYPNKIDDNPKNLFITFNAWVYSGTDLLWASLLEQMWSRVEEEFGSRQVRLHRASIRLAKEDLGNNNAGAVDLRTRQNLRYMALLLYRFNFFINHVFDSICYYSCDQSYKVEPTGYCNRRNFIIHRISTVFQLLLLHFTIAPQEQR